MVKKLLLAFALLVVVGVALGAAAMRRVEGEYFDSDGIRIHYTDEGSGEPVVLIHGFTLDIDTQWRMPGMIDALGPEFRVIGIDQRGHGLSDKPYEPALYGQSQVEDVIRLLDHLGIERAHLVGYSLGGFVTRRTALSHPERVISAVSAAAGWLRADGNPLDDPDRIAEALEREDFTPLMMELADVDGPTMPPIVAQLIGFGMATRNDGSALAAVFRASSGLSVEESELRGNRVPTLTFMGAKDPLAVGIEAIDVVTPVHETRIVDGYGHGLYPRYPGFEDEVRRFLASHAAR